MNTQPLRVGIGGPVGSGKTALTLALCLALRDRYNLAVVTNYIYTREDALTAGLFGPNPSADSFDRMGEIIAIAKGGLILIEEERESLEGSMVGHHGALTELENYVPLLQKTIN